MENWLSVIAGVYLLGMVLYGHHRGFIRLVVSIFAMILSLTVVRVSLPAVTTYLKENTTLQQTVSQNIVKAAGLAQEQSSGEEISDKPSAQRNHDRKSEFTRTIKSALIENNNSEIYQMMGVQAFTDYVGNYLADTIINSAGFVLLFAAVYMASK